MLPRDFFSHAVSVSEKVKETKASAYWPWLFFGEHRLVSQTGTAFFSVDWSQSARILRSVKFEAQGFWVALSSPGEVFIGSVGQEDAGVARPLKMPLPFGVGLSYLLSCGGWMVLHGALIVDPSDGFGFIVIGVSEAGKSTVANAALRAGLHVYADDLVALRLESGRLAGFGLRDFLRIRREMGAEIIPVQSFGDYAWVREVWIPSRQDVRVNKSSLVSLGSSERHLDVLDAISYGSTFLGMHPLSDVVSAVLNLKRQLLLSGLDMINCPESAFDFLLKSRNLSGL